MKKYFIMIAMSALMCSTTAVKATDTIEVFGSKGTKTSHYRDIVTLLMVKGIFDKSPELSGDWKNLIDRVSALSEYNKISEVNKEVNKLIKYTSDEKNNGVPEHWATPEETMNSRKGDCEDYVILKMWLLAKAGLKLENMFIVISGFNFSENTPASRLINYHNKRIAHAFLAYKSNNKTIILNNIGNDIREDNDFKGVVPLVSVNPFGLWKHVEGEFVGNRR